MHAEVQLLSPLVPVRQVRFIRFCKQHAEGVWAVVDVSIDIVHDAANAQPFMSCRRLPSGCIVQDMPNGYSKVSAPIFIKIEDIFDVSDVIVLQEVSLDFFVK